MFADSRLVSWARSALQWSLPIKLAVGAIVGLIGGGFLGYNAEYATYNYAIQYGVRAPIEGIPYLKAAVTFGSFFLLLTGSLVFFVVWLALKILLTPRILLDIFISPASRQNILNSPAVWLWVKKEIEAIGQPTWTERVPGKSWPRALSISLVLALAFPYLAWAGVSAIAEHPAPAGALWGFYAILAPYIFALSFILMRPKAVVSVATAATAIYFVASMVLLWVPTSHAKFLRHLGYGGGLPVRVELADDRTMHPSNKRENLYLMSRTTEAYILFDGTSNEFMEIPRSSIRRLFTPVGRIPWMYQLPE